MTGKKKSGRHDGLAVVGWAAPAGGGFGKISKIGKQPVNTQVGLYHNFATPENLPSGNWSPRPQVRPLYPNG
jgi:hypothetical protein